MISNMKSWYSTTASILLSTLLLFIAVNVFAYLVLALHSHKDARNPVEGLYGEAAVLKGYPGWAAEDVHTLLSETYTGLHIVYEPFTEFKQGTYHGRFVNVDEIGFRPITDQAQWPPRSEYFNIFVFGGSTTFGWGVDDGGTIPSYLQQFLRTSHSLRPAAVYNFGRGYYFSSQEAALYQRLLAAGFRPDVAIFIDGINDFYYLDGQPYFTELLRRFMDGKGCESPDWEARFPVLRIAASIRHRLLRVWGSVPPGRSEVSSAIDDDAHLEGVVMRWLQNKKVIEALAHAFNSMPIFVLQPTAAYKYDVEYDPFYRATFGPHPRSARGYPILHRMKESSNFGENVLSLYDIQEFRHENLYVDNFHYSQSFCREIAQRIYQFLRLRGAMPQTISTGQ
jgi:hypothetical protein